jgi:hypothetical protein
VITSREQLIHVLTEAAEVEHNLLCSYLYAAFSLKREGDPGLTGAQTQAVEGWRKTILKVALEEMAHLACVNNLLIAVGGAPHFDRPNFPVAPGYHPASVVVRLTPFDAKTLDHFIFLERPETIALADAEGFELEAPERVVEPNRLTPSAADYPTVGALYDSLADGFRRLAGALGEAVLIDASGDGQLDSEVIALPDIPKITNLECALAAIGQIKEQGEGSTGRDEASHFDRFVAIRESWAQLVAQDPAFEPAWPAAADPVMREPVQGVERVWVTAEPAAAYLDIGNAFYGAMLNMLNQTFGDPDPREQFMLMKASVEVMEACAAVATALARLPASEDHPGVNAGLSFAVPRNLGFRPGGSRVRETFAERLQLLRAAAPGVLSGAAAEKVERRLHNALELLAGRPKPD